MTELQLYKFVQEQEVDWRGKKLVLWIHPTDIKDFAKLLGNDYLCEGGLDVVLLTDGVIGVELNKVCYDFDIEPENIYPKES